MPVDIPSVVMAGLDPAICVQQRFASEDARIKSGHDGSLVASIGIHP
jgi:hypothetical protein